MDAVFHLAALIGIPHSYYAPADYVATNVQGTLNVLEACRIAKVKRVIHTSTSETYGTAQYLPIDEKHPLVGQSPYSASKIAADKLAESFCLSFGLPLVTVRPFNTFGPRQSARAVIPTILSQLLAGAGEPGTARQDPSPSPLPQGARGYNGRFCPAGLRLGSLQPKRDLTFVTDTAAGFLALACCDAAVGRVVNLGAGRAHSIEEIAKVCMAVVGRQVPIETDPGRVRPEKSEVMHLLADTRLARELTGWAPKVSLAEGVERSARFIREHPELYRPEEYQR
jgi:UDP-glucose 4-epimerase